MKRIFTILAAATFTLTTTACTQKNDNVVPATETAIATVETSGASEYSFRLPFKDSKKSFIRQI